MSAQIMDGRLAAALEADVVLARRGCTVAIVDGGGVSIERRGHHLGLWHWSSGMFSLIAAGYSESSVEMETVAEVVHFTRERFFSR